MPVCVPTILATQAQTVLCPFTSPFNMLHFFGTLCNYCYCVQFSASYQRHGEVDIFSSLELMVCRGDGCWIICSSLIYSTIFMACLTVYQALFLGLRLIGRSWPRQHLVEKTPKERTATWASSGAFRELGAVHVAFTRGGSALTVTSSGVRKSPGAVVSPSIPGGSTLTYASSGAVKGTGAIVAPRSPKG